MSPNPVNHQQQERNAELAPQIGDFEDVQE
jgi:hypothetical protein